MNALPNLQRLAAHLDNTARRWNDTQDVRDVAAVADSVIAYAEELKASRAARIAYLTREGPDAYYSHGDLTLVLLRDGKEFFLPCPEEFVEIIHTDTPGIGRRYYIHLKSMETGAEQAIDISKEEAAILKTRIFEANAVEYSKDRAD
jgi:hypothetical protein